MCKVMLIKRRLIHMGLVLGLMAVCLSGCNKKNSGSDDNNNQVQQNTDGTDNGQDTEVTREEPSLQKAAQKLTQFKTPKKGDTIAKIVVKDYGTMTFRMFSSQAPKAVENFITHAKDGYYDGVTFHRVIEDFMIQGGDPEGTGMGGESIWQTPFEDEFSDDLYPYRGALCMANSGADTNGSQFFVVQSDEDEVNRLQDLIMERYNLSLIDYSLQAYQTKLTKKELDNFLIYGGAPWLTRHHTVFGQLIEGFDVLDAIAEAKLKDTDGTPAEPVVIETITITKYGD